MMELSYLLMSLLSGGLAGWAVMEKSQNLMLFAIYLILSCIFGVLIKMEDK